MLFIKRKIRKFSLWLSYKTDRWVVSEEMWKNLTNGEDIRGYLKEQVKKFPEDPEISEAQGLITRFEILGK